MLKWSTGVSGHKKERYRDKIVLPEGFDIFVTVASIVNSSTEFYPPQGRIQRGSWVGRPPLSEDRKDFNQCHYSGIGLNLDFCI